MAADLWLLGHDDRSGRPLLQPRGLGTGLAGALLADLMLAGLVGLRPDGALVVAWDAARDAVKRDRVLRLVAAEPWPQPARSWLRFLARDASREVARGLAEAGYLRQVPGRGRRSQERWMPVNPEWAFAPMLLVRSALDPARSASAHAVVLAGLAVACGLGFRLERYQALAARPVGDAVARLDRGPRELIALTQAEVDSAVLSHRA